MSLPLSQFPSIPGGPSGADIIGLVRADANYQATVAQLVALFPSLTTNTFDIRANGALCDGAPDGSSGTDDTAAIQATIAQASAARGGVIMIPATSVLDSDLDVSNLHNITFQGVGGSGAGYNQPPPSQLIRRGASVGSNPFIKCSSTNRIGFRDLGVRNKDASFVNDLIALTNLTSPATADAAYGLVENCLVGGVNAGSVGPTSARSCISLEGAIFCAVINNHLQWANTGIRGRKQFGFGNVLYSTSHIIMGNVLDNLTTSGLYNPGEAWAVLANGFEGTNGRGSPNTGMPYAVLDQLTAGQGAGINAFGFRYNWIGDAVNMTDCALNFGTTTVSGAISDNSIAMYTAIIPAIRFQAAMLGFDICGNGINSFIDLGNIDHLAFKITENGMYSDPINLSAGSNNFTIENNIIQGGPSHAKIRKNYVEEATWGDTTGGGYIQALFQGIKEIRAYTGGVGSIRFAFDSLGFFNATPSGKPTIIGSRGGNAAVADLLTKLATLGLLTDGTTA